MRTARTLFNVAAKPASVVKAGTHGINTYNLDLSSNDKHVGLSQIALVIKAGSRYETTAGISSMVGYCRNLTNSVSTTLNQIKQLEQAGATFNCENTRDDIIYTFKCGSKLMNELFCEVVCPAIFLNSYTQHEVTDMEPIMKYFKSDLTKFEKQLDKLHEISFSKGGLENSIIFPEYKIGNGEHWGPPDTFTETTNFYMPMPELGTKHRVQSEQLRAYHDEFFTHDNISVYTSGMLPADSSKIVKQITQMSKAGSKLEPAKATFVSGEHRNNNGGQFFSGMIGYEGVPHGHKDSATFTVLAKCLNGVSCEYSNAGLLAIPTNDIRATYKKCLNLTEEQVENAKISCEVEHLFKNDSFDGQLKNVLRKSNLDFRAVTHSKVDKLAKKLSKGKTSLVAEGDLKDVPFCSELSEL